MTVIAESGAEESLLNLLTIHDALLAVIAVLLLLFAVCALVSIERSDVDAVPALVWVLIVLFIPIVGATAWFLYSAEYARRERNAA